MTPATPDTHVAPPARRARIDDIAYHAGVSAATVDRVLNRRSGVRSATAHRVLSVAGTLGYLPPAELYASLKPAPMELAFVLPAGTNRYMRMLIDCVEFSEEQLAPFNVKCRCHTIEGFNPEALARRLLQLGKRCDGIAFMALEDPRVREAVHTLVAADVPVLTLISDLSNSPRAAFVGMDNRAAGRTAGLLLGRFIAARAGSAGRRRKVAMFAGSMAYRGHEEREMGFRHILTESFPSLEVVGGLREGLDDADTNYAQARQLLRQHPDLVGIYNVGGASDGVARALQEAGRDTRLSFIGHGLTPDTRALLINGTMDAVINTFPQTIVNHSVRIFSNLREGKGALVGVEPVHISVVLRENLP